MTARLSDRRTFLCASISGTVVAAIGGDFLSVTQGSDVSGEPRTFTYKKVGDLKIKADVYGSTPEGNRPTAVWIHGGALIMGDRRGFDRALRDDLVREGYVVVSIDYRLAPETKLPLILEDVRDALDWVRSEGPRLFGAKTDKIVVLGGSAGGYLTLVTGYLVKPRPAALVSYWGYGDLTGAWYSRPDDFYRRQPLVSEAEARASLGSTALAEPPRDNRRSRFYLYCRQNGLWPKEVAGRDPDVESKAFDSFCPLRNVTASYPPTLLVHGTNDTDVPHEQSVLMDRELSRRGVPHEFITVPGAGHGLSGVGKPVIDTTRRRVIGFVRRFLG